VLSALTTGRAVVIMDNVKAELVANFRETKGDDGFTETVIWRVATPVRGSGHRYKYSLAFVVGGECVLRYDNEAGKGDHRHIGDAEEPYTFTSIEALLADFDADVERMKR